MLYMRKREPIHWLVAAPRKCVDPFLQNILLTADKELRWQKNTSREESGSLARLVLYRARSVGSLSTL